MYEMFAFELPWQKGSGDGLAAMSHGQTKPAPLEKFYPNVHPKINEAIKRCLHPQPSQRMQTMKEFLAASASVRSEDVDP